ncbi:MAG: hypothetical protein ACREM8_06910, partial [Vulcanimicrobiaceae bacterium]
MIEAIVAGSHLRFDGVRQRPQQLLTRLAERVPVLFVEEQFAAATDAEEWVKHGALTVLRPLRANADGTQIDAATLAAVRAWLGGRCALTWLYTPMMLPLADAEPGAPIVYDCMDDLASFRFAPAALGAREPALLDRATLIFAGGRTLYERRRAAGPRVRLYPSGVEFERFAQAQTLAPHPLTAALEPPVYGYFGVVDERIDLAIVDALGGSGANVLLIGPFAKLDPAGLPYRST